MADDKIKKAAEEVAKTMSEHLRREQKTSDEATQKEDTAKRQKAERDNRINEIASDVERIFNHFRDNMSTDRDFDARVLRADDTIYLQKGTRIGSITAKRLVFLLIEPAKKRDFGRPTVPSTTFVSVGIARGFERDNRDEYLFVYSTSDKTGSPMPIKLIIDPAADPRITVEQLTQTIIAAVTEASKRTDHQPPR